MGPGLRKRKQEHYPSKATCAPGSSMPSSSGVPVVECVCSGVHSRGVAQPSQ